MASLLDRRVGARLGAAVTSAGRPRDPRIDTALRQAVLQLLVEDSYLGLTVQAVARRAGVSAPAIYRRFPGKLELVEWALFPAYRWTDPPYTGDYATDLTMLVRVLLTWLSLPASRAALPGLLGEYVRDSQRYTRLLQATEGPVRDGFHELVSAAVRRGEARADAPIEAILDVLLGAVLLEALVRGDTDLDASSRRIAEVVRRATD